MGHEERARGPVGLHPDHSDPAGYERDEETTVRAGWSEVDRDAALVEAVEAVEAAAVEAAEAAEAAAFILEEKARR